MSDHTLVLIALSLASFAGLRATITRVGKEDPKPGDVLDAVFFIGVTVAADIALFLAVKPWTWL